MKNPTPGAAKADPSQALRENATRNIGTVTAAIKKAESDHQQLRARMRQRHDELNREIAELQNHLADHMDSWDEEDRRELEQLLAERQHLSVILGG